MGGLLHLDTPRARRDCALFRHPLGARTDRVLKTQNQSRVKTGMIWEGVGVWISFDLPLDCYEIISFDFGDAYMSFPLENLCH